MRYLKKFDHYKLTERLGISEDVELLSDEIYNKLKDSDKFILNISDYSTFPKDIKYLSVEYSPNFENSSCVRNSTDTVAIKINKKIYSIIMHEVNHIYTSKNHRDVNKSTNKYNAQYTYTVFPHSNCTLYHLLYLTFGEEINSRVAETYVSLLNTYTTKSEFLDNLKINPIYLLMKNAKSAVENIDNLFRSDKSEFRRFVYYYNISSKNIKYKIETDNTLTWRNILNMALSKFKIVKPYDEASDEEVYKFINKFQPLMLKKINRYFKKVYRMYDLMDEIFIGKDILSKEDKMENFRELIKQVSDPEAKSVIQSIIDKSK